MTTETGSLSQLITKFATTDDLKERLELSEEIKKGSKRIRITLKEPTVDYYPFRFKAGDIVARKVEDVVDMETKGEVIDGVYDGTIKPGGWYTMIYTVKRLKDGVTYDAQDLNLVAVNPKD